MSNVQPFFRNMAEQYRRATCVVARAGAITLAELASRDCRPSWFHARHRLDARLVADLVAEPTSPATDCLRASFVRLLSDHPLRDRLRRNLRALAQPLAASAVVEISSERSILRA